MPLYKFNRYVLFKHITFEDFCLIISVSSQVVLKWSTYHATFQHDAKSLLPYDGTSGLFGYDSTKFPIAVRSYSYKDFWNSIVKNVKIADILVDTLVFHIIPNTDIPSILSFTGTEQIQKYIDYSTMISMLEEKKLVSTIPSKYVLANDERRFILDGEEYEVDCLGSSMFTRLTNYIENLWNETFEPTLKNPSDSFNSSSENDTGVTTKVDEMSH